MLYYKHKKGSNRPQGLTNEKEIETPPFLTTKYTRVVFLSAKTEKRY